MLSTPGAAEINLLTAAAAPVGHGQGWVPGPDTSERERFLVDAWRGFLAMASAPLNHAF